MTRLLFARARRFFVGVLPSVEICEIGVTWRHLAPQADDRDEIVRRLEAIQGGGVYAAAERLVHFLDQNQTARLTFALHNDSGIGLEKPDRAALRRPHL